MTDKSTVPAPPSADSEKRQKALKVKIYDWRKKGYNVSRFSTLIQRDISIAEEEFEEFLKTVRQMEKIEERLYRLDSNGFEDHVKKIEDMMREPDQIEELEKEIILLEEKVLRHKIEGSGGKDQESIERELKTELDKIREEELKRVRGEEAERIREQERKRILEEELGRIREEERERLKKTELDHIRKEEKERLVWEDRVVRQLKQAKEQKKDRTKGKEMTCPSCKESIPITSEKRPLKIRCPNCGKDYTLRAKGDTSKQPSTGPKMQYKKCPKCSSPIPIVSDKRPLKIICQMCNAEYNLKSRKTDGVQSSVAGGPEALANTSLPSKQSRSQGLETKDYGSQNIRDNGVIACPTCNREIPADAKICGYCGSPIDSREVVQKQQSVPCPNCGKEIPGDARICGYCGSPVGPRGQTGPADSFELPTSPHEKTLEDLSGRKDFKPLNNYSIPSGPDLSGPGTAPPGSMELFTGPAEGITCPKCGNIVPRGAKFCGVCGNTM